MNKKISRIGIDILCYIIGSLIYSAAVSMFISPNEISPGGLTGIATVLNYLFTLPSGITLFLLNIPLILLGFFKLGGIFIVKTSIATIILSASLTLTDAILPVFQVDKILASVFGGIIMGLGLSIVMRRGASTGGIDIIAKIINKRFRHLTVGRLILIIDAFVIVIATIAYKNLESALYSIVALYASSIVLDTVLYGADKGKLIYIVTQFPQDVCNEINTVISRGVTIINAKGGYTGQDRALLLCTVRRYEVSAVYNIVDKYDRNAFIVLSDVGEIIGEGFKRMN
ncbi:MAG: YitT family protein [Ruminococcaceae bacterium]|nr:YitT family protein [Oscillospiraceae bacterium]